MSEREHLFKAKNLKNEWVDGYYCKANKHWHKFGIHKDWIITGAIQNGGTFNVTNRYPIIKETVCEKTGKNDKNGKAIYSGDLVNFLGIACKVVFEQGAFGLMSDTNFRYGFISENAERATGREWAGLACDNFISLWQIAWNFDCEESDLTVCEVIGNIYDKGANK